jgi:aldehyde dehydrogenase (NAD+)
MVLEYAPALESTSILKLEKQYQHFIGGKFVVPAEGKYFESINPATGEVIAEFALGSAKDVEKAVLAARNAYEKSWKKLDPKERGKYIFRIARLIQERSRELAVAETIDNGKPIRETRDIDLPQVAAHFFYHAGWADKLDYAGVGSKYSSYGVVGQIIPWNFPLLMLAWKIAPALATGNTVVLKPAETTPLTAILFGEICQQADLPAGVVNIVTGDGSTGKEIVNHKGIDKIAFTGSTEVGRFIAQAVSGTNKALSLELGGKGANIVFEDAPLDETVEGIVNGIFFNQGHVCCAGSRLLLQENIADIVIEKLKRRMELIRVGNPLDKNTDLGAINNAPQLAKIKELTEVGVNEGGKLWVPKTTLPTQGFWCAPTLFTGASQAHRIAQEEIFGPVLTTLTFRTPEEGIEKANNTPYGLSAGVWSDKGSRTLWAASQLKAGVIWSNTFNKFDPTSPFGGYKESGWGREGGRHGLLPYLKVEG